MPRALFEKTGNAVWMSHLDLMRLLQRAFKRAGLHLKHTQGFNPRPSVSIALPMSVGVESVCELLDFDLEGQNISCDEIRDRLNAALVEGVTVREVYEEGAKLKHLAFLDCCLTMEYDNGIPGDAAEKIRMLLSSSAVVEKRGKNGITEQDIAPMIRSLLLAQTDANSLTMHTRICCQNPTLNPALIAAAVERYLPECRPDHVRYRRMEVYDTENNIFR
jgi:radical SAM-linked protein